MAILALGVLQPPVAIPGLGTVDVAPPYLVTPPVSIPASTGRSTYGLPIPAAPSLPGFELFTQALVVDSAHPSQSRPTGYVVDSLLR